MASTVEVASSFIEGAPPGEVCTSTMILDPLFPSHCLPEDRLAVANMSFYSSQMSSPVNYPLKRYLTRSPQSGPLLDGDTDPCRSFLDVQALTSEGEDIVSSLLPAFKSYNETQLATVKLPGSSQEVSKMESFVLCLVADARSRKRSSLVNSTRWRITDTLIRRAKPPSRSTMPHR
jgi:hypothetical protein